VPSPAPDTPKPAAAPASDSEDKLFTDLSVPPDQEIIDLIKADLKFNRKGNPLNTVENLSLILSRDTCFAHIARFDRATGAIKHSPSFHGIDHLYAEITKYLSEKYNLETTVPKIDWLVNFLAYRDSINSLVILYRRLGPSPAENPLDSILGKVVLQDPSILPELHEALDLFFKKAALQVFVPELSDKVFPNDIIIIFKGPQGIGKTLIIKSISLSPDAYYDAGAGSMDEIATRDGYMKLAGLDICELGEFRMHNVVERLKSLASLTTFVFRPPYGRGNVTIPRTVSFIGSTNAEEFLLDGTGNRRYFPFSLVRIDFSLFHDDAYLFPQLRAWYRDWAVKFIQDAGEDLDRKLFGIHESEALIEYLARGREEARVISPSEDLVEEYIECVQDAVNRLDFDKLRSTRPTSPYWKEYYSAIEAAKLIFPSGRIPNDFYRVFGEVMAARDFTYARIKIAGRQFRAWTPKKVTGDRVTPPSEHVESESKRESIDMGIADTGCHPSPCHPEPELFIESPDSSPSMPLVDVPTSEHQAEPEPPEPIDPLTCSEAEVRELAARLVPHVPQAAADYLRGMVEGINQVNAITRELIALALEQAGQI
jgi:hypothetical protein